jgi:hypothetical protein
LDIIVGGFPVSLDLWAAFLIIMESKVLTLPIVAMRSGLRGRWEGGYWRDFANPFFIASQLGWVGVLLIFLGAWPGWLLISSALFTPLLCVEADRRHELAETNVF